MDAIALVVLLAVLVVVAAVSSGGFIAWFREEWRAARADTWETARPQLSGPTGDEAAVQAVLIRQLRTASRMRRHGRHLLNGKGYTPELTKPVRPEKSERRVLPFRRP